MPDSPPSPASPVRFHFLGLCFVAGLIAFALVVRHTVISTKRLDEYVTVRGLSEREVPADLGIWPITFTLLDNDLSKLLEQIQKSRTVVKDFLTGQGFGAGEISNAPPEITDQAEKADDDEKKKPAYRYHAEVTVLLRTENVARMKVALESSDHLVQQGIVLSYTNKLQFRFNGLNKLKPAMIEEANKDARRAAEKFAADSQARIGAIKHALQGSFEINDVDSSSPDRKTVRVVTTVDFYLD